MAELVELREENALMRADLSANHHFNQVAMNEVGSDSGSDTSSPGPSPKAAPTSRFGEEERNSPATAKKGQRSPKRPVWASPAPRSSFGKQLHESKSSHSLQRLALTDIAVVEEENEQGRDETIVWRHHLGLSLRSSM